MTDHPTRQAIAAQGRSGKLTVSGKLKTAIELMVWQGARRQDAATQAGLQDHSLRAALKKPHVLRFYTAELGVLRESLRAKNFHRLDAIADESGNAMARVAAIKTMEQLTETETASRSGIVPAQPGLQIVLIQPPAAAPAQILDVTPQKNERTVEEGGE